MAEQQPAGNPAPNGGTATPPPEPVTPPAGAQAANTISFDSFSDDDKKYLSGQGITKQEDLTSEAITKLVNHARSSQQTAAERQSELDRLKNGGTPPTTPPANPDGTTPPVTPSSTTPPAGETPAATAAAQAPTVDPVQMFMLGNTLVSNFPELKDDLISGEFYKKMNQLGIPTLDSEGKVNLNGILSYGGLAQKSAQDAARIEELSKPGAIPNANPTAPVQPDANTPMSKQLAQAIISRDPTNPRAAEATKYLQDNAK